MADTAFFKLSEDILLSILFKLEEDPRNWARLACVCTKFLSLVRAICYKSKCTATIPSVVADLIHPGSESPPGGWAPLFKLAVCCPGIHHAGVLLDNSDFGLERELGPEDSFPTSTASAAPSSSHGGGNLENSNAVSAGSECYWSLDDDLYLDSVYDPSETVDGAAVEETLEMAVDESDREVEPSSPAKKRKICRPMRSHLASGVWNLSREQGNKLLASRFRGDCLYLCDWPGCVHIEEKRNYMLFRGVFKNFKKSRVWRTINDGNRGKIDLSCAFCSCNQTWDLHSAFCLRRGFGYHEDGDPVVRAYVCENGHVSGAWTDLPLYI